LPCTANECYQRDTLTSSIRFYKNLNATHGAEIVYVMENLAGLNPPERILSKQIGHYWAQVCCDGASDYGGDTRQQLLLTLVVATQFARCGNPNGCSDLKAPHNISVPYWPQMTENGRSLTLALDLNITVLPYQFHQDICTSWYNMLKPRWSWE
jgi:carboxylesterase type B